MNLSISGHHLVVTPALREYVTNKLERIRHHFDQVIDVSVILSVDKLQQKAEATLHVSGDHGPDTGRVPAGTGPAFTGAADEYQLRDMEEEFRDQVAEGAPAPELSAQRS